MATENNEQEKMPGFKNLENENNEEQNDDIVMGTEADVTDEDMEILGDKEQDMDMGEDEALEGKGLDTTDADGVPLNEKQGEIDSTGADLDVPGSELDDANEAIGEEDEENNYYSQSDNHDR